MALDETEEEKIARPDKREQLLKYGFKRSIIPDTNF